MENWDQINKFLQPKMPLYCPEVKTMSVAQKVFLRTNAQEVLYGGQAGGGKLCRSSTKIATPTGWSTIGDVHPGDIVFGRNGEPRLVESESEEVFVPGWRLTFDDESWIDAHDDHLWLTYTATDLWNLTTKNEEWRERRRAKRPSRAKGLQGEYKSAVITERNKRCRNPIQDAPTGSVKTTTEIVGTLLTPRGRRNHAIPVAEPLHLPHRELPMDPYVLGAWLGDGNTQDPVITSMDPEIIQEIENAGFAVRRVAPQKNNKSSHFSFYDLRDALKKTGVLGNKHVPDDYLWASEEQRLALLQGLLDADGNVSKASVEFVSTLQCLTEAVAQLARSLGMKVTVHERRAKLNGLDYGPKWCVKFAANRIVFRLPRKAEQQSISSRRTNQFRYIVSAERIEPTMMKCLRVSSPDHLFLIGEHFIPTHNSSALLMGALQFTDVPGYVAMIFRRTFADLDLPGAIMDRFRGWIAPYPEVHWNASKYVATFPSGARIQFGYLNNRDDFLRYQGMNAQYVAMDEATQLRYDDYIFLFSRMRKPRDGPLAKVPIRMRCASNPAPNWVRQRFIVEGKKEGRIFIPASFDQNPGIDAEDYRRQLAILNPVLRRQLEHGDWWTTTLGSMFLSEDFVRLEPGMNEHEEPLIFSHQTRFVRFWDFAATEATDDNKDPRSGASIDPDWTVGTLMAMHEGKFYILDVKRIRKRSEKVEQLVAATAASDGLGVAIRIEQEPGSAGKAIVDSYARKVVPGYDFQGIRPTGDKELRARPMAAAVANSNVFIVTADWNSRWLEEFSSFPEECDHDDQVDSAVGAFTHLTGFGLVGRKRASLIV